MTAAEWLRERAESHQRDAIELREDNDEPMAAAYRCIAAELRECARKIEASEFDVDIKARVAAKRNQAGEANHMWKGDDAGYQAMHLRVEAARGRPSECVACGSTEPKRYEWANLSGRYDDTSDYVRLCVPCHRRFDASRRHLGGDAK